MGFFDGGVEEKGDRSREPIEGDHVIRIYELYMLKTREYGNCPAFKGRIVESTTDKIGTEVGKVYFINSGKELTKKYTRGDLLSFGRALQAALGGDPSNTDAVMALVQEGFMDEEQQKTQPARGVDIQCTTTKNEKGFLNHRFSGVEHTAEQIKAQREQVESVTNGESIVQAAAQEQKAAPVAQPSILSRLGK